MTNSFLSMGRETKLHRGIKILGEGCHSNQIVEVIHGGDKPMQGWTNMGGGQTWGRGETRGRGTNMGEGDKVGTSGPGCLYCTTTRCCTLKGLHTITRRLLPKKRTVLCQFRKKFTQKIFWPFQKFLKISMLS